MTSPDLRIAGISWFRGGRAEGKGECLARTIRGGMALRRAVSQRSAPSHVNVMPAWGSSWG